MGWTQPIDLVGWSMGGLIALDFALDHHDRVRSLVLIEPDAPWVLPDSGRGDPDVRRAEDLATRFASAVTEDDLAALMVESSARAHRRERVPYALRTGSPVAYLACASGGAPRAGRDLSPPRSTHPIREARAARQGRGNGALQRHHDRRPRGHSSERPSGRPRGRAYGSGRSDRSVHRGDGGVSGGRVEVAPPPRTFCHTSRSERVADASSFDVARRAAAAARGFRQRDSPSVGERTAARR
jgi:hypothetical protein